MFEAELKACREGARRRIEVYSFSSQCKGARLVAEGHHVLPQNSEKHVDTRGPSSFALGLDFKPVQFFHGEGRQINVSTAPSSSAGKRKLCLRTHPGMFGGIMIAWQATEG